MLHKIFFTIVVCLSCGTALWYGRNNERWTAAALLASGAASVFAQSSVFFDPEFGILIIDFALLGFLIWLAMHSDRFWPLYAAGFQVVGSTIHLARLVDTELWAKAYATAQVFWAYPVLLALLAGTWFEARYRRQ